MPNLDPFSEIESEYARLKSRLDRKEITREEFKTKLKGLQVRDASGRLWQIDRHTDTWIYFDGKGWLRGDPRAGGKRVTATAPGQFSKAEAEYGHLKRRLDRKEITREEFKAELRAQQVTDASGRLWQIDRHTGDWIYFDGKGWLRGDPRKASTPRWSGGIAVGIAILVVLLVLGGGFSLAMTQVTPASTNTGNIPTRTLQPLYPVQTYAARMRTKTRVSQSNNPSVVSPLQTPFLR